MLPRPDMSMILEADHQCVVSNSRQDPCVRLSDYVSPTGRCLAVLCRISRHVALNRRWIQHVLIVLHAPGIPETAIMFFKTRTSAPRRTPPVVWN